MKRSGWFLRVFCLVVLLSCGFHPAAAQSFTQVSGRDGDYLLLLPLPEPDEILDSGLSPMLSPGQAEQLALEWVEDAAIPYWSSLQGLVAEGFLDRFETRPDLNAILLVGVSDPAGLRRIEEMPGGLPILPAGQVLVCAQRRAGQLAAGIFSLSSLGLSPWIEAESAGGLDAQATARPPSIHIQGQVDSPALQVSGRTGARRLVTLRVYRGGALEAEDTTYSSRTGFYNFQPGEDCTTGLPEYTILPDDLVEVTAGGRTASTRYINLMARADPDSDVVDGEAQAGRQVMITLYHAANTCRATPYTRIARKSTDPSDQFSYDFRGRPNFNGLASLVVSARETNGNSTYTAIQAYHLALTSGSSDVSGVIRPGEDLQAWVNRGGAIITGSASYTQADGHFIATFPEPPLPGDWVYASAGPVRLVTTVANLEVQMKLAGNRAVGETLPGVRVQARFRSDRTHSCARHSTCHTTLAGAKGQFALSAGFDLQRGDLAEFTLIDQAGNIQFLTRHAPLLLADLSHYSISGFWNVPTTNELTITHKSSGGEVLSSSLMTPTGDWFDFTLPEILEDGDQVEVSDGATTEKMTVGSLEGGIFASSQALKGQASRGRLTALLGDFRPETERVSTFCQSAWVGNSNYSLRFSGARLGPFDGALLQLTGPDGQVTLRVAHALSILTRLDAPLVHVYAPLAESPVYANLYDETGELLESYSGSSNAAGEILFGFSTPLTAGQTLEVVFDGKAASILLPVLSATPDAAENRVFGQSPAKKPVWIFLGKTSVGESWLIGEKGTADADGNYFISFKGKIARYGGCSEEVQVANFDRLELRYYTPEGYGVYQP